MADGSKVDELFKKTAVSSPYEVDDDSVDYDDVLEEAEDTKASGTRARAFLREIGIEKDIRQCVAGISNAKNKFEVGNYKAKLEALLKIVQIHKAAADTANKNSALASADGSNFDEVKITLQR
jgi:hypothetical protein